MHSKSYVPRKTRTTYNLERREYYTNFVSKVQIMWQLIWQVALIARVQNYHVPKDTRALNAYIYCLVLHSKL
jgi:hypothetical protein